MGTASAGSVSEGAVSGIAQSSESMRQSKLWEFPSRGFHSSSSHSPVLFSESIIQKLKKAVAVSEENIQQHSRRRGQFSSSRVPCRKVPKPWQGLHFALPENQGIIFQQRRNLPENLSSKEFLTATAFSSSLNNCGMSNSKLRISRFQTSDFRRDSWGPA